MMDFIISITALLTMACLFYYGLANASDVNESFLVFNFNKKYRKYLLLKNKNKSTINLITILNVILCLLAFVSLFSPKYSNSNVFKNVLINRLENFYILWCFCILIDTLLCVHLNRKYSGIILNNGFFKWIVFSLDGIQFIDKTKLLIPWSDVKFLKEKEVNSKQKIEIISNNKNIYYIANRPEVREELFDYFEEHNSSKIE